MAQKNIFVDMLRARSTVGQMMKIRGYQSTDTEDEFYYRLESDKDFNPAQEEVFRHIMQRNISFANPFASKFFYMGLDALYVHPETKERALVCFYAPHNVQAMASGEEQTKKDVLDQIFALFLNAKHPLLKNEPAQRFIFVIYNKFTSSAEQAFQSISSAIEKESFLARELLFNPLQHILQPTFEIKDKEYIKEVCKRSDINPNKLPKISTKDIVARFLGLRRGQGLLAVFDTDVDQIVTKHARLRIVV